MLFVFTPYIGLVLLQDHMTRELWFWDGGKPPDDHQQGLQTCQSQLVTVICGCHEGHANQVTKMENQEV